MQQLSLDAVTVVARYRLWKAWARMVLLAALICALPSIWMYVVHMLSAADAPKRGTVLLILLPFLGVWLAILLFRMFRNVVFRGGRFIWIEDGLLIWDSLPRFSVRCSDIAKVLDGCDGLFNQFDTITLFLRDGSERVIRTDAMSEDGDVVVERLKGVLGLRQHPNPSGTLLGDPNGGK